MTIHQTIEEKIQTGLAPNHLDVLNESHMHNVPPGSESHFKLVIVSPAFENLSLVQRHQKVNAILAKELKEDTHALSMETHTDDEWEQRLGRTLASPQCHGASKADS
ncbi:MAG: BolA/IbaG family iron-sulfur metabolism protein [Alphaproteobacteria bacterium]|nr:BolA/IbaG family iron-sulfur metabolism protein [Alphaproteobacteria bacterium]